MKSFLNKIVGIEEIVNNYFNESQLEDIKLNLFFNQINDGRKKTFSSLKKNKINLNGSFNLDLFITYSESHLNKIKFIQMMFQIGDYYLEAGNLSVSENIFSKIISQCNNNSQLLAYKANSFLLIAEIHSYSAKWDVCLSNLKKSINLFKRLNDMIGVAKCENLFGTIYGERGNLLEAKEHFERSLKKLADYDDYNTIGKIEINLGIINIIQGNLFRASGYLRKALKNYTKLKDLKRIAQIRMNLGILAIKGQDYQKAIKELDKALEISKANKFEYIECVCLINKVTALVKSGEINKAEHYLYSIKDLSSKLNDKLSLAEYYRIQGMIYTHYQNFNIAEQYFLTSLRMNKELDNALSAAETQIDLAILYQKINNRKQSTSFLREAFYYFRDINAAIELNLLLKYM